MPLRQQLEPRGEPIYCHYLKLIEQVTRQCLPQQQGIGITVFDQQDCGSGLRHAADSAGRVATLNQKWRMDWMASTNE